MNGGKDLYETNEMYIHLLAVSILGMSGVGKKVDILILLAREGHWLNLTTRENAKVSVVDSVALDDGEGRVFYERSEQADIYEFLALPIVRGAVDAINGSKEVTSVTSPALNQYGCTLIVLAEWKLPVNDNEKGITLVFAPAQKLDPQIHPYKSLLNNILGKVRLKRNILAKEIAVATWGG